MQRFTTVDPTKFISDSSVDINNALNSLSSCHEGTAFPTNNLARGQLCYRSDLKKLYQLETVSPATWRLIADLARDITHASLADVATTARACTGDADTVDGKHATDTVGQIALKDENNDLNCRMLRQSYADQSTMSGGMVFRANNTNDNYLRVCSNTAAIRKFLGLGNVNDTADGQKSVKHAASADNAVNAENAVNAQAAVKLESARMINGVAFDGTKDITVKGFDEDAVMSFGQGSTQPYRKVGVNSTNVADTASGGGNISLYYLHTHTGMNAGVYTLKSLLQALVNRAHSHTVSTERYNCNCNCSDDGE